MFDSIPPFALQVCQNRLLPRKGGNCWVQPVDSSQRRGCQRNESLTQAFQVLWQGKMDLRIVKQELKRLRCRILAIKIRGTDHDPSSLMSKLNLDQGAESSESVLIIGRHQAGVYAAITSPVARSSLSGDGLAKR